MRGQQPFPVRAAVDIRLTASLDSRRGSTQAARYVMAAIMITCRTTGREVYTGIDMDEDTFSTIPNIPMQTHCPHCGGDHVWWTRNAFLSHAFKLWPDMNQNLENGQAG
jgi:hypothetical protein